MEQSKFYQIKNITEHEYILVGCDGSIITRPIRDIDKTATAFTIQDAKDGDVLVEDSCIFIIQKLGDNNTAAKIYCTLFDDGDFDDGAILYFDIDSTKPATKEQRDLLFQKMKEAGYEWDAEKKELKKIENEIEIPFGAKDSDLQEVAYYIPKGFHAEIDDDKVIIKKGKKTAAWSEDDESYLNTTIAYLKDAKEFKKTAENCINWLKSLKGRVLSKQEWSKEDSIRLQRIIDFLWYNRKGDTDTIYQQEQDIDWLKSLIPQKNWKPTEEQLRELHCVISGCSYETPILVELEKQLKNLL